MKIAVLIPTFDHGRSLCGVIEAVRAIIQPLEEFGEIIVVNDGSADATREILQSLPDLTVLTHERNRGKGHALMTGFGCAHEKGYTHVVSVDADGQHRTADIGRLVRGAREFPEDLIIGHRDMDAERDENNGEPVPVWSRRGRNASRFWLRLETGQDIPDSQCGLRIYPLRHVFALRCRFHRFDFETEVLARLAWAGLKIRSVPVACIYFPGSSRVSHFRPVLDTLRCVRAHALLVFRRMMPLATPRLVENRMNGLDFGPWWQWTSWHRALRNVLNAGSSNSELATSFAMGIFVGLTPLFLMHTLLVIYLARRLHLNVLAALIGSQISIPPLVPIWMVLSYGIGNMLLHGQWAAADTATFTRQMIPALLVGILPVAITLAMMGLIAARCVLSSVRPERITVPASRRGG